MKYTRILIITLLMALSLSLVAEEFQDLTAEGKKNLRSAKMHLSGGRFEKALPLYMNVIEENPNHIEALDKIAGIYYERKGDYYLASDYIDKAIAAIDKELDVYEKMIEENPKKENKYRKKMEPFVESKDRLLLLKKGCWVNLFKSARGKFDFANDYYTMKPETLDLSDQATVDALNAKLSLMGPETITPENPMTIEEITAKFDNVLDESINDFEKLYEFAPDSTNTVKMLAFAYNVKGDEDKKIEYFEKAAGINPDDELVRQQLGNVFFNREDYENAIKWFSAARDVNPENVDNYNNLGIVYTNLGNDSLAMANYEKVVEKNPENLTAVIKVSNIAAKLQNISKSIEYLKKANELDPENIDFLKFLTYRLYGEKRYEETAEYAQKWYNLDSTSKEAASLVYQSAKEIGNTELEKQFEEVLKQ